MQKRKSDGKQVKTAKLQQNSPNLAKKYPLSVLAQRIHMNKYSKVNGNRRPHGQSNRLFRLQNEYVSSLKIAYKELGIAAKPRGTFMASNKEGV